MDAQTYRWSPEVERQFLALVEVGCTPAIIADRKPGKTIPAVRPISFSFSPRSTAVAMTSTLASRRSVLPASGSATTGVSITVKLMSSGFVAACSRWRRMIQNQTQKMMIHSRSLSHQHRDPPI